MLFDGNLTKTWLCLSECITQYLKDVVADTKELTVSVGLVQGMINFTDNQKIYICQIKSKLDRI
jgi:hypothetical protein